MLGSKFVWRTWWLYKNPEVDSSYCFCNLKIMIDPKQRSFTGEMFSIGRLPWLSEIVWFFMTDKLFGCTFFQYFCQYICHFAKMTKHYFGCFYAVILLFFCHFASKCWCILMICMLACYVEPPIGSIRMPPCQFAIYLGMASLPWCIGCWFGVWKSWRRHRSALCQKHSHWVAIYAAYRIGRL